MKLRIAVNRSAFQDQPRETASGWLNINEDLTLQGWVSAGYGWCCTHFVDRYRKADNARGSNLVAIDIDGALRCLLRIL